MANIFEFLSKDGNITPEKARKSRQMQFHDKTAYVWGLRYRWDPSLSMNPVRRFAHFMPPWLCSKYFHSPHDVVLIASKWIEYENEKCGGYDRGLGALSPIPAISIYFHSPQLTEILDYYRYVPTIGLQFTSVILSEQIFCNAHYCLLT